MAALIELAYLAAAILFIIGLKRLAHPATARRGNVASAVGMLIAIVATLVDRQILSFPLILVGGVIGSALGLWMARAVKMTAMPQMVGIMNGFGGGASLLVAAAEWHRLVQPDAVLELNTAVSIYASTLVGAVTFSGSMATTSARLSQCRPLNPNRHPVERARRRVPRGGVDHVVRADQTPSSSSPTWRWILDADRAANVIVMKRSMNPGFAGVENELFYNPKTAMLFGNAKDSLLRLIAEVKAV
ncbi:MAG: NAD(P)(+) transhydrogenase (Re/Si-specific) subunit beta [Gemmatimonadetes bacterium]|nr:NAD(P)(+) transhydrogenase (Re/Si-specific) subunit beta [Gemmatimonadota bacterium]